MESTDDILAEIEARGLIVDWGSLIGGPFIPDGTACIYDPETWIIWGQGDGLEDAYEHARSLIRWEEG